MQCSVRKAEKDVKSMHAFSKTESEVAQTCLDGLLFVYALADRYERAMREREEACHRQRA